MHEFPEIPHADALLKFIDAAPSPLHAAAKVAGQLRAAGYRRLDEGGEWRLQPGDKVFCRRGGSLIAMDYARPAEACGLRMVAAHTDSPGLTLKPNAAVTREGYAQLAAEVYGGALLNPWFDRGLGIAGRVIFQTAAGAVARRLINIARPVAVIPSLAIHLDRAANTNRTINKQNDLPAVLGLAGENSIATTDDLHNFLIAELHRQYADEDLRATEILAHDLWLYDVQPGARAGVNGEFIHSARLDNLLSCYAGTAALLAAKAATNKVLILTDYEEVGSVSAGGAAGAWAHSVVARFCGGPAAMARAMHRSMLISADNAHGVHPNYAAMHEPAHKPRLNAGVVIKINGNQRYATDAETAAVFKQICARRGLPVQYFVTRSDLACGSTIGPIVAANLGVRAIDVGAPQLAMHSVRELAGAYDVPVLADALGEFFNTAALPF